MIVLDTCALIWLANTPAALSPPAAAAISRESGALAVVPISAWEIAVKVSSGRLLIHGDFGPLEWYEQVRDRYGMLELPLDARTLCAAAALPLIHRDPCDRMILAAALAAGAPILTADRTFAAYPGVRVIW